MANAERILALKLVSDVSSIKKGFKDVTKQTNTLSDSFKKMGKAIVFSVAIGGMDVLSRALQDGIRDVEETRRSTANLSRTWAALGQDGSKLAGVIASVGESAINLGFDDTESVNAYDTFLKRTKDTVISMELLAAAQDLARTKGIPLGQAVEEVGRIFAGNKKVLQRYGLEGGKGIDAVRKALDSTKGAAKEYVNTTAGQWEKLTGQIGEVFEDVAGLFAGLPPQVATSLVALIPVAIQSGIAFGASWQSFALLGFVGLAAAAIGVMVALAANGTLHDQGIKTGLRVGNAIADGFGDARWKNTPLKVKTEFLEVISHYVTDWFSSALVPAFRTGWNGMVNAALAPFQRRQSLIQDAVGAIRDMWNSLDFRIPRFDIPRFEIHWKPDTGNGDIDNALAINLGAGPFHIWDGTGDLIPDVGGTRHGGPGGHRGGSHRKGLWDVPVDDYSAILHRGEMVVPSDFAQNMRSGGGMGSTYNVHLSGIITDPTATGRAIVKAIQDYERRGGTSWRAA